MEHKHVDTKEYERLFNEASHGIFGEAEACIAVRADGCEHNEASHGSSVARGSQNVLDVVQVLLGGVDVDGKHRSVHNIHREIVKEDYRYQESKSFVLHEPLWNLSPVRVQTTA